MMIKTPIADFLDEYAGKRAARFHMPGHKGRGPDAEKYDITEIDGAGNLFSESGIVAESEAVASKLFGCRTYYSAEGSSLAIRTMLALAIKRRRGRVVAGRNAHRSFLSAAVMLDLDVEWIFPSSDEPYLSCSLTPERVAEAIDNAGEVSCVYITSPDYLGNVADVGKISKVCRAKGVMLLVDNAHGAYLKFLEPSRHPIDLGADMCADSAHKTLPVLTGGAYLHLSESAEAEFGDIVKETMELFASSSPSYLIMRSLDEANAYLGTFPEKLSAFAEKTRRVKEDLRRGGYVLIGDEVLKITVFAKAYGYTGDGMSALLYEKGVICEFHDPDFISFMLTPENTDEDLERLCSALAGIEKRPALEASFPPRGVPVRAMSPRAAFFSPCETVPAEQSVGRIMASCSVPCPPAVPPVVCGEVVTEDAVRQLKYYGINKLSVVK